MVSDKNWKIEQAEEVFIQEYAGGGSYNDCVRKWRELMALPAGSLDVPPDDVYQRAIDERAIKLDTVMKASRIELNAAAKKAVATINLFLAEGRNDANALKAAIWVLEFIYRDQGANNTLVANFITQGGEDGKTLAERARELANLADRTSPVRVGGEQRASVDCNPPSDQG